VTEEVVVFVHGIWMPGGEMWPFKRFLQRDHDLSGELFSYHSVGDTLDQNASKLARFVMELGVPRVHLVGHSLGGVLALRALTIVPDMPPGRIVCLGSPLNGSQAADHLSEHHWGKAIIGSALVQGVIDQPAANWAGNVMEQRDVGAVAGTLSIGLGKLFANFDGENDGTVAVTETRLPGLKDHICHATNHTGLIFSEAVATQTAAFLKHGKFIHDPG